MDREIIYDIDDFQYELTLFKYIDEPSITSESRPYGETDQERFSCNGNGGDALQREKTHAEVTLKVKSHYFSKSQNYSKENLQNLLYYLVCISFYSVTILIIRRLISLFCV